MRTWVLWAPFDLARFGHRAAFVVAVPLAPSRGRVFPEAGPQLLAHLLDGYLHRGANAETNLVLRNPGI